MSASRRRVLVLAYRFPACRAFPTAAARTAGWASGLVAHGWEPVVVAPQLTDELCGGPGCGHPHLDEAHDRGLPYRVVRVPVRPTVAASAQRRLEARSGGLARLGRQMAVGAGLLRPGRTDWHRRSREVARALLSREAFDVVWTTAGPYVMVGVGRDLQRASGLPWVLDLRDPMARVIGTRPIVSQVEFARRRLWRRHLAAADLVVEATDGFARIDRQWLDRRYEVVRSGFDQAQWRDVHDPARVRQRPEQFELAYFGALYAGRREPDVFLEGLALLEGRGVPAPRLAYHGMDGAALAAAARRIGVAHLVEDRGPLTVDAAHAAMADAPALLLLNNTGDYDDWPGGKFYEYLAARRPILAVPDSDAYVRQTLAATRAGVAAGTAEEVADVLGAWSARAREPAGLSHEADEAAVAAHSTEAGAARIAELLVELVSEADPTR